MARAFSDAFPRALMMGMSYEQYWDGDPWLYADYREADRLAQEREAYGRWLTGMYVYDAIGRLVPVLNPFPKKHRAEPYPEEPYEVARTRDSEKTQEQLEKESHDRTKAWLMSFTIG